MTNRYEAAAAEVERLEKLDLQKWLATGRWAEEIWG